MMFAKQCGCGSCCSLLHPRVRVSGSLLRRRGGCRTAGCGRRSCGRRSCGRSCRRRSRSRRTGAWYRASGCRSQPQVRGIVDHHVRQVINDLRIVHSGLKQRCVQDLFALVYQSLSDLRPNVRTLESQVFVLQTLLTEFEHIPLTATKPNRLSNVARLHVEEAAGELRRKSVLPEILFGGKSKIAPARECVDVFTLRPCYCREISAALKLLRNIVNLQFRFCFVLGIVSDTR